MLNLYFMRGDLQREYNALENPQVLGNFCNWLSARRTESNITSDEIALFRKFAQRKPEHIARMRFLYQHFGEPFREGVSLYDVGRAGARDRRPGSSSTTSSSGWSRSPGSTSPLCFPRRSAPAPRDARRATSRA